MFHICFCTKWFVLNDIGLTKKYLKGFRRGKVELLLEIPIFYFKFIFQ